MKSGITINVEVSFKIQKNIMCSKKAIFGNSVLVISKMVIV